MTNAFLTRAQAADTLDITTRQVRRLALAGLYPHRQPDGRWLYRLDEVEARKQEVSR
ncbi:helix-turn-helix domain-containing protein [Nonomuraea sp. NPDC047529]|uniref:helix-turn-helix domain-containing protein n=1 Tax=Nonomuraea sp. NPDC047529 TaxID=3155623 RepID=UPI0033EBE15B